MCPKSYSVDGSGRTFSARQCQDSWLVVQTICYPSSDCLPSMRLTYPLASTIMVCPIIASAIMISPISLSLSVHVVEG